MLNLLSVRNYVYKFNLIFHCLKISVFIHLAILSEIFSFVKEHKVVIDVWNNVGLFCLCKFLVACKVHHLSILGTNEWGAEKNLIATVFMQWKNIAVMMNLHLA